jgi:hypothetical protein
VPVDSQIGDGPGDLVSDQQPARAHRPLFPAGCRTSAQGVEKPVGEVVLGALLEGAHHGRGDFLVGQQVAGCEAVLSGAAAVPAQRAGAGIGRCSPCYVDDRELAVLGEWRPCDHLVQRVRGRAPVFHEVEDLLRQGGICDVLGGYGAHAGARPGAAR